ncbi:hypothetical protein AKJ37_04045 [candidate division MSBL1 archaeon SCGC-AAA259I09]|uniref:Uncharacterized protein n=1 Tax=candidate division MSBL1 archaeon SCGC-AAA259I09 TaxID=1698267 RepID=A0A133US60_9EURY|nr:hypothetical protein AKJ37_04045 [candidate division MSBL1 archaeon SCGC-AAA259I09]
MEIVGAPTIFENDKIASSGKFITLLAPDLRTGLPVVRRAAAGGKVLVHQHFFYTGGSNNCVTGDTAPRANS